ncbi:hypothetical protein IT774_15295 [Salinimonas marina]|uniref:Porin n=1 Tax=Salinimonas marina TaxID=2785918 RepID=A0A7S9DWU3_9ALTE|nr:hypothetical protein [Salinimonas marina]QPG05442.1 hypothetical protein IT774_15295 [Salinimonas marina]
MNNVSCIKAAHYVGLVAVLGWVYSGSSDAAGIELFDGKVKSNLYLAQGFQHIQADDGAFINQNTQMESGFQRFRFNLDVAVKVNDIVSAYIDLGEEPNDFGSDDQFEISQDLAYIDIALDGFEQWHYDQTKLVVRAGNIVSTVFDFRGYSDGAAVQTNPLIGNSPIDFVTAESGAQVLWSHTPASTATATVYADAGITIPTFFEDYGPGRGYNYFGKVGVTGSEDGWGLSVAAFMSDQADQFNHREFDDIQTAGLIQGDGDNYNFAGSGSNARDTHAGLLPGLDARIYQLNAFYRPNQATLLRAWAGRASDEYRFADANNELTVASQARNFIRQDGSMQFYALEGSYYIVPSRFYLAARYSAADNTSSDAAGSDTLLSRSQVGLGWFITTGTLLKAEYVYQLEEVNSPGQIGADWQGVSVELSLKY